MPSRQDLPIIIALGVVMKGLFISLSHVGMVIVGFERVALLGYSTPLWVTPFATLLFGEPLSLTQIAGLVVITTGIGLVTLSETRYGASAAA